MYIINEDNKLLSRSFSKFIKLQGPSLSGEMLIRYYELSTSQYYERQHLCFSHQFRIPGSESVNKCRLE